MNFADFKNRHANESILVCGLGESANLLSDPTGYMTIGVNDIGRLFQPTYLLNVNNKSQYKGDRFSYIENSQAKYLFTHQPKEQGNVKIPIVEFKIARKVGTVEIEEDGALPHFRNSPYVAVALAAYMGATRIGLLGVDFTDNHFWVKDGPHRLLRELEAIDAQYGKLAVYLQAKGIGVWNLSPISRLTKLPKVNLEEWSYASNQSNVA